MYRLSHKTRTTLFCLISWLPEHLQSKMMPVSKDTGPAFFWRNNQYYCQILANYVAMLYLTPCWEPPSTWMSCLQELLFLHFLSHLCTEDRTPRILIFKQKESVKLNYMVSTYFGPFHIHIMHEFQTLHNKYVLKITWMVRVYHPGDF